MQGCPSVHKYNQYTLHRLWLVVFDFISHFNHIFFFPLDFLRRLPVTFFLLLLLLLFTIKLQMYYIETCSCCVFHHLWSFWNDTVQQNIWELELWIILVTTVLTKCENQQVDVVYVWTRHRRLHDFLIYLINFSWRKMRACNVSLCIFVVHIYILVKYTGKKKFLEI